MNFHNARLLRKWVFVGGAQLNERSSRESTLSFRPSHGVSYNQQQHQGPQLGGDFQPRAHHHYPFPERPPAGAAHEPGAGSQ
ncbi:hypothetical protein MTO96_014797 [Rhipicephalus appendiculatus]